MILVLAQGEIITKSRHSIDEKKTFSDMIDTVLVSALDVA